MEKAAEKILHIRLGAYLSQREIVSNMGEKKYDKNVRRAAFGEKAKAFLSEIFGGLLYMLIGPVIITVGVLLITNNSKDLQALLLIVGLILVFGLGLGLLRMIPTGAKLFSHAWDLLSPVKRGSALKAAEKFYYAWNRYYEKDWGSLYKLFAPYTANRLPIKIFKAAWQWFHGKGDEILLPDRMQEKLESAIKDNKEIMSCSLCGVEKKVYHSELLLRWGEEELPSAMIECPECNAVYCRKCFGELDSGKCSKCGGTLNGKDVCMHFEEYSAAAIMLVQKDKEDELKAVKPIKHISIEDIDNVSKKLEFQWYGFVRLEAPHGQSSEEKAKEIKPKVIKLLLCIIHVEKHAVKIDNKWYLTEALPPDDCVVEWEEIRAEEEEKEVKTQEEEWSKFPAFR